MRLPNAISVVVVDDHTLLRVALCNMLRAEEGIDVVADVGDGWTCIATAARLLPDVIILDIEIPGDGVHATLRQLAEVSPNSRILILSMHRDVDLIRELSDSGIAGYLHKSASGESLVAAIRGAGVGPRDPVLVVSAGELHIFSQDCNYGLTGREIEVINHVADALSNRQIASQLGISESTVKRHMGRIFEKLGAVSRLDAVNRAVAAKVIKPRMGQ
ncbi:response regulator [Nocardia sp. NPDC020380]|uniref:response regulator n=1 Tax=Nocardia sp. NPDC020380 TaxID=3364309 RepID=UPI003792CAA3